MSVGSPTPAGASGVVTHASPLSFPDMVRRLLDLVESKGLRVFAVVDHSGEAARAGLKMNDTQLIVFGSPAAGTPVMVASPLAALDLPLKVLVWSDGDDRVWVSYNDPEYLASRYGLTAELEQRLAGVVPLVESAVAPDPAR